MTKKPDYPTTDETEEVQASLGQNELQKLAEKQSKDMHKKQAEEAKKGAAFGHSSEPIGKTPQKEAADEAKASGNVIVGALTQSEGEILVKPATEAELAAARDAKDTVNLHPFVPGQNPYPDPSNPDVLKRDQMAVSNVDIKALIQARRAAKKAVYVDPDNKELGHADFSGKDVKDMNFEGNNLRGANFSGANVAGANFKRANLQGADFRGTKGLDKANFEGADLQWVHADPKTDETE